MGTQEKKMIDDQKVFHFIKKDAEEVQKDKSCMAGGRGLDPCQMKLAWSAEGRPAQPRLLLKILKIFQEFGRHGIVMYLKTRDINLWVNLFMDHHAALKPSTVAVHKSDLDDGANMLVNKLKQGPKDGRHGSLGLQVILNGFPLAPNLFQQVKSLPEQLLVLTDFTT